MTQPFTPDPELDLVLQRDIDVPPELVWACWTQPEHVCKWFCPAPWSVSECDIDLRPGGVFRTVFCGPDGEKMDNSGCYLEVVPQQRLVWTSSLLPGFRPATEVFIPMTAIITIEPSGSGSRYTAVCLHGDRATRDQHNEMGFELGWSAALDQLVALAKTM